VTAVFHGHAHKGAPEGKTQGGIPVYNVAHAVLKARLSGPAAVSAIRDRHDDTATRASRRSPTVATTAAARPTDRPDKQRRPANPS
jgi:hypothetical protein